ncbi:peptide-binding protein [Limisalsivibrio acetivorans]|uniref:peptide-binding protein n=1 Tax=Limisalsivibrio acetivorans TaxID=1304888 RepID=UPI0003B4E6EB|nr:peptide-binding protein [Limisalsivibrio acetivorans]
MRRLLLLLSTALVISCSSQPESGDKKDSGSAQKKGGAEVSDKIEASGKAAEKPVDGGALINPTLADASGLIYNITSDSASHEVSNYIYNGLVEYDKNLEVKPDLAESWDVSEDQKSITFHLRKDVTWHDGEPFNADDVEFTYKFMIDNNTPTSYDADYRLVKQFEKLDNYTVRVSYDKPYAPALISWGMAVLPEHLLKGEDPAKSPLMREPVGTGPYVFEEWKTGESITLVANDEYFEGRPHIDRLIFRVIPDIATTFMELLNGAIDIMGLTPLQWTKQTDNAKFKEQYNKYTYLASSYTYIGYNLNNPMFKDKRVRQALTHATPKQKIVDGILFGLGRPATGPYKPGTIWHNPDVKTYPYDVEQAKALLAEAGWSDSDGDGIIDKDGKPFKFQLMTNQGNSVRIKIAETIQQHWKELGIDVEIRVLEWATFINEYIDNQKFDAVVMGWNIIHDPDIYDVWHSKNCAPKKLNFVCFQNEEADELIEQGRHELNPEKRKEYYHRFQEILAEEQPYTFLYIPDALVALSKRFKNVEPAPAGIAYNVEEWYIPAAEQKYHFTK